MKRDEGFIKQVILIIIALIAIKYYFHFDMLEWAKSPEGQSFMAPLLSVIKILYLWCDMAVRSIVNR